MPTQYSFDGYSNILDKYKMEYFNYSPNEDILEVYARLCKQIGKGKYTHLIGHSMGGGLLMRYIYDHKINNSVKIILLMPMIYKIPLNEIIAKIPISKYIKIPKALLIPNSKLYNHGNFLNDSYNLLSISQAVSMYKSIMLDSVEFASTINNSNCVLFYATREAFNIIPEKELNLIKPKKLVIINGLHECFNSIGGDSREFFKKLALHI
jgi:pimeloyl-ACP methyl ester carboxylesterase